MLAQGLIADHIDIFQLGYRTDVSASAGTHNAGGCVDVGQYHGAQIQVWREWGWTMQRRDLNGVKTHAHGWPYKCTHLSPAAQKQEADWDKKDAGLVGSAQVVGLWPVLPWDVALARKVDDLPTPEDVWNWDGIPAPINDPTPDPKNPEWKAKNAINTLLEVSYDIQKRIAAIEKQIGS